jgi:hypothetical protein
MSLPSSPGKMDLSALSGLKRRVLQPVPSAPGEVALAGEDPETKPKTAPEALDASPEPKFAPAPATSESSPGEPSTGEEPEPDTSTTASVERSVNQPAPTVASTATSMIEPAEEEHSGHVTLYLPKDLNQWLGEHHDSTEISYPGIVLNAISWAAGENRFGEIFAPVDSPIPANDIFGRAPALPKLARGSVEPETRPLRFRKDHMKVIISLARTWTADNRNAFFVGVLTAYRDQWSKD